MFTGHKHLKYGLTIPAQKPKTKPTGVKGPIPVFAQDDSDDDGNNVGKAVARQAATKRTDKKVEQMHAAALQEDASVFDYDGVYDSIQATREQPRQAEKLARKSRYIESLLDKAKDREKEQDIVYERRLAKEREVEDHLYGDKDKFVTGAYRKKLEEEAKWKAEEAVREAREKAEDVTKRGHLGHFYKNLLTNNTAMGTSKAAAAKPSATPAEQPEAAAAAGSLPPSATAAPAVVSQAAREPEGASDGWEAARQARQQHDPAATSTSGHDAGASAPADQIHRSRHDGEDRHASAERSSRGGTHEKSSHRHADADAHHAHQHPDSNRSRDGGHQAGDRRHADDNRLDGFERSGADPGAALGGLEVRKRPEPPKQAHAAQQQPGPGSGPQQQGSGSAEADSAAAAAAARRNKEEQVAAARERFLMRKRKAVDTAPE